MEHANLSPSSSHRWLYCPGSVEATKNLTQKNNIFSAEGTKAHTLASECLINNRNTDYYSNRLLKIEDDKEEVFKPDNDMIYYIQQFINYVRSIRGKNNTLYIKKKVSLDQIVPDCYGTVDAIVVDKDDKACHIIDLKYGKGVEVDVYNNSQLSLYALGAIQSLDDMEAIDSFTLHIYQNRIGNISEYKIAKKDLLKFSDFVKQQVKLINSPNPKRIPGESQCKWCLAKSTCPALSKFITKDLALDYENLDLVVQKNKLTDDKLKLILDNSKLIQDFINAIHKDVYKRIKEGGKFDGYKIVRGRTRRFWGSEAEEALVSKLGDKAYKNDLIGITTADNLLGKNFVDSITDKKTGAEVLVKDSDNRPAIDMASDYIDYEEK